MEVVRLANALGAEIRGSDITQRLFEEEIDA